MAKRNSLFKSMTDRLIREGLAETEAKGLAKEALRGSKSSGKKCGAGGQSSQTKPVTILNDACDGIHPECDATSKFMTITGNHPNDWIYPLVAM